MKTVNLIIAMTFTLIFIISLISCSMEKKPVVKADPDSEKEEWIVERHDSDSILERMPVKKTTVDPTLSESEELVDLVTYNAAIARIMTEFQKQGKSPDDISSAEEWNKFIEGRSKGNEAFVLDNELEITNVVMLEKVYFDAKDIGSDFRDTLYTEEEGDWTLFLYMKNENGSQIDFEKSFAGVRLSNVSDRSLSELRAIPRMVFTEEDVVLFRIATRTSAQDIFRSPPPPKKS